MITLFLRLFLSSHLHTLTNQTSNTNSPLKQKRTVSPTHNFSDTKCVGFAVRPSNSETEYLESAQGPQVESSVPQTSPRCCLQVQASPNTLAGPQSGVPTIPSGSMICSNSAQNSGNIYLDLLVSHTGFVLYTYNKEQR